MNYGMHFSVSAALIIDDIQGPHLHLLSLLSGHSQRWLHPRKIFPYILDTAKAALSSAAGHILLNFEESRYGGRPPPT